MQKFGWYIISFIEGLLLMAFQLIISRILAAGFGTTLNVWAFILSAVLLGLGFGYFYGGKIASNHSRSLKILKINLGFIFMLFLILPYFEKFILDISMNIPGVSGLIFFSVFGIFPISFLLGMVTPIIISKVDNSNNKRNGSIAGKLYANSTLGGILGTFLFGLILIPEQGIWISCLILSLLAGTSFILSLLYKN